MSLQIQLGQILDKLCHFKDKTNRKLSPVFMAVPSPVDYPDYASIVKTPIAIETIRARVDSNAYPGVSQFLADFQLMFSNAKTYNRKGTFVYNDANTLSGVLEAELIKTFGKNYASYTDPGELSPVCLVVSDVLKKVIGVTDSYGRDITDLFMEIPDRSVYPQYYQQIRTPIAFDSMVHKAHRNLYQTVDEFAKDFNLLISNAQQFNQQGSQVWADANTLKALFNKHMKKHAQAEPKESAVDELESFKANGKTYRVGDYVYVGKPEDTTIVLICHIWKEKTGAVGFTGTWFLRPEQTMQKPGSKFFEKEVLKSNRTAENHAVSEVLGQAWVLHSKDYIRGKPPGSDPKHLHVCENRYSEPNKAVSKIKNWHTGLPEQLIELEDQLELYSAPIALFRNTPLKVEELPPRKAKRESLPDPQMEERAAKHRRLSVPVPVEPTKKEPEIPLRMLEKPKAQESVQRAARGSGQPRPNYFTPYPHTGVTLLPSELVDSFDVSGDRTIKWFAVPPVDVVASEPVYHSIEYLYQKALEKLSRKDEKKKKIVLNVPISPPRPASPAKMDVDETDENPAELKRALSTTLDALANTWLQQSKALLNL